MKFIREAGVTRRQFVKGAVAVPAAILSGSRDGWANPVPSVEEAMAQLLRGRMASPSHRVTLSVPKTFDYGSTVPLAVAVESPMTDADYVKRIDIFASGNPLAEVLTLHFTPHGAPARAATRFRLSKGNHTVHALAELSNGTVLSAAAEVEAASEGCGGQAGSIPDARTLLPVPRVSVQQNAVKGEIVDVPSMITHRMESGFRTGSGGQLIPRFIIHRMECRYAGRMVVSASLSPAIAANAYLKFPILALETGDVALTWHEDGGATYVTSRHLTVGEKA